MKILSLLLLSLLLISSARAKSLDYNPAVSKAEVATHLTSTSYEGREVPLKFYLPKKSSTSAPVVLLSHGLGGSREIGAYLGNHWAGRGYVVVAMQHIGSDESVWKNTPRAQIHGKMKAAASAESFSDRMKDVPAVLDQLEKWNVKKGHVLEGRMNLKKIGIGGHSFGAITTQAIAGQDFGPMGKKYLDPRIDAAFAMSPSPPKGGSAEKAFAEFKLPALLMTGTKDKSVIGGGSPEDRLKVYAAMPEGAKYQLVLKDAEHSAFSDHQRRQSGKNPNHHRVIQALSSAFWDSYLKGDLAATAWLKGAKPKTLMEKGDLWEHK